MGITVFSVISEGLEIYENDQLIYFKSDTVQNDKKKFVEVFLDEENRNFKINGSSYKGTGNLENIIGNWWNHRLLQSDTQISPLSGSIKKQSVEFLKKEKIRLYENEINVEKNDVANEFVKTLQKNQRRIPTIVFEDGTFLVEPSDVELELKLQELNLI